MSCFPESFKRRLVDTHPKGDGGHDNMDVTFNPSWMDLTRGVSTPSAE